MIILVKYTSRFMGSQTSVRAGNVEELKYQIFFRDNLKMLLDQGYNAKSPKVKKQFEYAESIYQAQCNGTLTEEMLAEFAFETDLGGFQCIKAAKTADEIDELVKELLAITADRRQHNPHTAETVGEVIALLEQAKFAETPEVIKAINGIHHVL